MKSEELLMEVLRNRNPALFIGAGFSYGAMNGEGVGLPVGHELAFELYEKVLQPNINNDKRETKIDDQRAKYDLKYICDVLELKELNNARDKFLTKRFKGCYSNDSYHGIIKEYDWRYIFSLNIDDLVENIYENRINIQLLGGDSEEIGYPTLIKLHGSVLKPELSYVFSQKEYDRYLSQDSWAINAFATEYFRNDIIFLGTEFQEDDLRNIINKFSDAGAATRAHHYFFVTPKLNDSILEMQIDQNDNFYHIRMTTEDFFQFIVSDVAQKRTQKRLLTSQGAIFLDDEKKNYRPSFLDVGRLYQGDMPQFVDFFGDWDIRYPNADLWTQKAIDEKKHGVLSLYGDPYCGKSCIAMRMLVDLYNSGYFSFKYSISVDLDAIQYSRLIIEYLSLLPTGAKCAILAENMAHFYSNLKYIVEKCPKNISHLIIIVTAEKEEHIIKRYIFDSVDWFEEHKISYKINNKFAHNIYDKLDQKNHLNNLLKYADGKAKCIQYIKKLNDIIEVLFLAHEGRKFSAHFAAWVDQKGENSINGKLFQMLCFLGGLGINEVPLQFFLRIGAEIGFRVEFNDFYQEYGDYLVLEKGCLRVRCLRIINQKVLGDITNQEKYQIILKAAGYYAPLLDDRKCSIPDRIFQMLIKVKNISQKKILPNDQILNLLVELESKAKHLSYYWIQRGIANRNLENFEEANNDFMQAAAIRGRVSYNIEHAQAKNYMAWGLWLLKHNANDTLELFERGQNMLKNLIINSPRRYYVYSVHSYTDMMIKYFNIKNAIPPQDELNFIVHNLQEISWAHENDYSTQIVSFFNQYCKKVGLDIHLKEGKINNNDIIDIDDIGKD